MTLPIPQSTAPLLVPTGSSTGQGTTAADAEVASAFRDALAVALGDTASTRTRRRAGDQQGTETISTLDTADDAVDEATAAATQPVTTPREVRSPSIPTTNGEVLRREGDEGADTENGLVAGRRAHRTEGTTTPEAAAEEWAPAIVITPVAIPVLTPMTVEAATTTSRMDSRDILVPEFRGRLERVIERMEQEFGYTVEVIETGRTQERQDALFAQGRTAPGPIVTWTRASRHTHGLAADVTIDGGWSDRTAFARLAAIAEEEGLRTLGPRDPGHIELPGPNVSRPVAERVATRPVFPGTPRPVADPADRLFERPTSMPGRVSIMPVDRGGVSIMPVDRGNVSIMPVDDGRVSVMPVEPGRVSVMPVEPGRVSVMPVESERVSTMPVRPPRVGGDELLHVLPAVPSRDHPRGDHAEEPTLRVLPVTNPDRGVDTPRVPLEQLFEEFPMALGTPRPAVKAAPPAPTGIATVAKVAPVADVARVATVAAPALVHNEAPRVTRDASPRLREGQESLAIPERAVDA
ncbi:MAG: M15 family metallopeptidase, partial [Gemmatimonadetes bacterium]|nr:M15 family metallopeptidase [Gemmatimonadota bacterium]